MCLVLMVQLMDSLEIPKYTYRYTPYDVQKESDIIDFRPYGGDYHQGLQHTKMCGVKLRVLFSAKLNAINY